MNKLITTLLLSVAASAVFAVTPPSAMQAESLPAACTKIRQQMYQNHLAIDKAFDKQDACTMGKLMIQNRQLFESNPACFPRMKKNSAPAAANSVSK